MATTSILDTVARVLEPIGGAAPVSSERQRGGDINDAHRVRLADGSSVFAKVRRSSDPPLPGFFAAEAAGLRWLAESGAVRVPEVIAVHDRADAADADDADADHDELDVPSVLVLSWIDAAPGAPDHDERLGRQLAAVHRSGAPNFGFEADNYLGTLRQHNEPARTWAELYGNQRLAPLARRAVDRGWLPASTTASLDRLLTRLDDLTGPPEPPARLHGDLWAGNAMTDEHGDPVLIDPAVYGGHREVDLAMMRLFGGFGAAVFAAYDEVHPLADGHAERVAVYQLYPLLAHVNLFPSAGYQTSVLEVLGRLA
jgi:fructosamine-3-kinase